MKKQNTIDTQNGGTFMTEKKITFTCPMAFVVAPEDIDEDCYDVDNSHFAEFTDEINSAIRANLNENPDTAERGLAALIKFPNLNSKIISAFPSVENRNGELCGVVNVKLAEDLNERELNLLTDNLAYQLSSKWGYNFATDTVRLGDENAYIGFRSERQGEQLLAADTQNFSDFSMGGLS